MKENSNDNCNGCKFRCSKKTYNIDKNNCPCFECLVKTMCLGDCPELTIYLLRAELDFISTVVEGYSIK